MTNDANGITLSVVVNVHSEGRLLRPTLRSLAAAIQEVTATSRSCELVIVLDNATPETLAEATLWREPGRTVVPVRLVEVSNGDAGASRNAGAASAQGRFVAFCDGDDLVSHNYLIEGVRALEDSALPIIVHPATVLSFGARSAIWTVPATEDVDHLLLIRNNLWPSSSISLRTTYLDHPYRVIPPGDGFGPEDWLWNIETSVARIPHRPVPGTMFFYRVREFGGVNNGHLHSILPPFDLDGLVAAMPARPETPAPVGRSARDRVKWLIRTAYRATKPVARVLLAALSQPTKERLYAWAMGLYTRRPPVAPAAVVDLLKRAAEIEPAISWTANGYTTVPEWRPFVDGYGQLLVDLVAQLRPFPRAIVAVPWVGIGGADLVSLNYARTLAANPRFQGGVTMLATYTPANTQPHLVPEGVRFVQVSQGIRALTPNQQRRILAQALLIVAPELVVSVNCFDVTNSLHLYGHQLASAMRINVTLFAFDRIGLGYPVNPITDDGQRYYLDEIEGIITDNTVTASIISEMLALAPAKVRVHHQPALETIPPLRTATRSYEDTSFSEQKPFRLLWPHRLDKEKRPDSLIRIAQLLRERELPVAISVHGQQVLSSNGASLMKSLAAAGITYRGPYSGGLPALPTDEYHALLLTSESEGLPLVLVQSMLLGLPVISTAVGGVTDIVQDNVTGLLVSHPDDAEGFVRAISQLMDSVEDRRRIIRAAYDFAVAQHGWERFASLVDTL